VRGKAKDVKGGLSHIHRSLWNAGGGGGFPASFANIPSFCLV
jgi:hypothetical protein